MNVKLLIDNETIIDKDTNSEILGIQTSTGLIPISNEIKLGVYTGTSKDRKTLRKYWVTEKLPGGTFVVWSKQFHLRELMTRSEINSRLTYIEPLHPEIYDRRSYSKFYRENSNFGSRVKIETEEDLDKASESTIRYLLRRDKIPEHLVDKARQRIHYIESERWQNRANRNRILTGETILKYTAEEIDYLIERKEFLKLHYKILRKAVKDGKITSPDDIETIEKIARAQQKYERDKSRGKIYPEKNAVEFGAKYWNSLMENTSYSKQNDIKIILETKQYDKLTAGSIIYQLKHKADCYTPEELKTLESLRLEKQREYLIEYKERKGIKPKRKSKPIKKEAKEKPDTTQPKLTKEEAPKPKDPELIKYDTPKELRAEAKIASDKDRQAMIEAFLNNNPEKRSKDTPFNTYTPFRWD